MDKSQILKLIKYPASLDASTLPEITDLVKQFPYCQTLHLLHLYNLKNTNNIHYSTRLKVAAIYSADRKRLFHLVNDEVVKEAAKEKESVITPGYENVAVDETENLFHEEQVEQDDDSGIDAKLIESKKEHIKDEVKSPNEILPPKNATEIIQNRLREISGRTSRVEKPEELSPPVRDNTKPDPLLNPDSNEKPGDFKDNQSIDSGQEVTEETVSHDLTVEGSPKENSPSDQDEQIGSASNPDAVTTEAEYNELSQPEIIDDDGVAEDNLPEPEEQMDEIPVEETQESPSEFADVHYETLLPQDKPVHLQSEKHSFTDWLKLMKSPAVHHQISENENVEVHISRDQLSIDSTDTHETNLSHPAEQNELIEKFIKENPKIISGKAEFFSPMNMAKNSAVEHEDLFSETLAGILFEQGLYERSKTMYQKLILNYPEKSSYFAARIKEIDELLNQ